MNGKKKKVILTKKESVIIAMISTTLLLIAGAFLIGINIAKKQTVEIGYDTALTALGDDETVYVCTPVGADTDCICATVAYATLKKSLGRTVSIVLPKDCGGEAKYVLDRAGVTLPGADEAAEADNIQNAEQNTKQDTKQNTKQDTKQDTKQVTKQEGKKLILIGCESEDEVPVNDEGAEVLELIGNSGAGDISTGKQTMIKCIPFGAVCTVVYSSYVEYGIEPDIKTSLLLASGIISATDNLSAKSTTEADRTALQVLAKKAEIKRPKEYYKEISAKREAQPDLQSGKKLFFEDYKEYDIAGRKVGIGAIKVKESEEAEAALAMLYSDASVLLTESGTELIYALVTDKSKDRTVLFGYPFEAQNIALQAFDAEESGIIEFVPSVSRKKVVVPTLTKFMEKVQNEKAK